MSAAFQAIEQRPGYAPYKSAAGFPPRHADADVLAPLHRHAVTVTAERNEEIFAEGTPAKYCYLVVSGCVRTVKLMEDGRRQIGEFLLPGDLFAWEALDTHDFSAEAVTRVTLRRVPRALLEDFADRDRDFGRRLRELTARQLRAARERMMLLARKTASEKIASFLLEMERRVYTDGRGLLDLPMGRTDVADHLGLTIETVCRGLTELRRHGTIAVDRTRIAIRNRHALGSSECSMVH